MSVGLMPAPNPPTFDPLECASRSHEVQRLAWRMQSCVDQVDTVLTSLRRAQVDDWLSPAGRAYRTTIALHASALMRAREIGGGGSGPGPSSLPKRLSLKRTGSVMADSAPIGAGTAPEPSQPASDGILSIRGGVGGMSFQLEELLRGAGTLDELVQQLVGIENEARQVQDCLEPFLYDSYRTGCDALNAVAVSAKEVGKVRQELVKVAAGVRASHRDYVEAEARNARPTNWTMINIGFPAHMAFSRWDGTFRRTTTTAASPTAIRRRTLSTSFLIRHCWPPTSPAG